MLHPDVKKLLKKSGGIFGFETMEHDEDDGILRALEGLGLVSLISTKRKKLSGGNEFVFHKWKITSKGKDALKKVI